MNEKNYTPQVARNAGESSVKELKGVLNKVLKELNKIDLDDDYANSMISDIMYNAGFIEIASNTEDEIPKAVKERVLELYDVEDLQDLEQAAWEWDTDLDGASGGLGVYYSPKYNVIIILGGKWYKHSNSYTIHYRIVPLSRGDDE